MIEAKKLIETGADVNAKSNHGDSLIHLLSIRECTGYKMAQIKELVDKYDAYIDIQNADGLTSLQCLISDRFTIDHAANRIMKMISLGADPNMLSIDETIQ